MSESPWYREARPGSRLTQGDIIVNCPLVVWDPSSRLRGVQAEETLKSATRFFTADVIVMSQACDLEQEKVTNVVLCPHQGLSEHRAWWEEEARRYNQNHSEKSWTSHQEGIRKSSYSNLYLLNKYDSGAQDMECRVVDFAEVYSVPRTFLESLLKHRKQVRLRLKSPYRAHLSHAFAGFFMRVALPNVISPFR